MIALLTLLMVVTLSVLITRGATHALMLTGLSRDVARFQARSVTTGTGFTSSESEHITGHPARRRIALALMLVQNAGLVAIISTFILSFVDTGALADRAKRRTDRQKARPSRRCAGRMPGNTPTRPSAGQQAGRKREKARQRERARRGISRVTIISTLHRVHVDILKRIAPDIHYLSWREPPPALSTRYSQPAARRDHA